MREWTLGEYAYVVATGLIQGILDLWMVSAYVKCKKNKKIAKYLLIVLLAIHDIFWSLVGESGNNVLFCIEITLFYPIVFLVLYAFYKGRARWNFIYIFAVEYSYQVLATVISIPFLAGRFRGNMNAVVDYMDTVSVSLLCFTVSISIGAAWVTKIIWSYLYKLKSGLLNILCLILSCLDIGALIFYGWIGVSISFSAMFLLAIIFFVYQNRREEKLSEQFKYYQAVEKIQTQKEKEISMIRHDIVNHLGVMEQMEKEEERKALLKVIDKGNRHITYIPILDCLIREKESECVKRGIEFEKQSIPFQNISISEYDLISLFANLLDNAMEAAAATKDPFVKMDIEKKQGHLRVVIKNSKQEESNPLRSGFMTTKSDKTKHGFGNRIIKEIVAANDGYIVYKDEGDFMTASVIFDL